MRRKAQSQIITTILLILIVLAAVVVVWVIVNNFLKPIQGDEAVMCVEVKLNIVRADSSTDQVVVTRLAGGDENYVTGMKFLVNDQAATVTNDGSDPCDDTDTDTTNDCDLSLELLETKTVTLGTNFVTGDDVTVAAQVGDTKFVCNLADRTKAI